MSLDKTRTHPVDDYTDPHLWGSLPLNPQKQADEPFTHERSDASHENMIFNELEDSKVSTPKPRRRGPRKPFHNIKQKPPSPLPPSSPLGSSPPCNNATNLVEEDSDVDLEDPFGFIAAEKRLKARKHIIPPKPRLEVESPEDDVSVGEAFATQGESAADHKPLSTISHGRKRAAPASPSATSILTGSEPSSPCQQAMRRKSATQPGKKNRNKMERQITKGRKVGDLRDENPVHITLELEALLPKRHNRKQRARTKKSDNRKAADGNKNPRKGVKKEGLPKPPLVHLNKAEREKFESERDKRLEYYKQLDMYSIAKENTWTV